MSLFLDEGEEGMTSLAVWACVFGVLFEIVVVGPCEKKMELKDKEVMAAHQAEMDYCKPVCAPYFVLRKAEDGCVCDTTRKIVKGKR